MMPTAAKLIAAVAFAIVAFIAAATYVPHMPEGSQIGLFREITAGIGFAVGWFVMGGLVGPGYAEAAASGVRTSVTLVFFALLGFSVLQMVKKSYKMLYDGPMEAVLGVFEIMLDYGRMMLQPDVLGVLAVGGILGGMLAEWAGRRWS
jgi:hypothetical protein